MRCATCRGTGRNQKPNVACRMCDGTGKEDMARLKEMTSDSNQAAAGRDPAYYRDTNIQPWDAMEAWMPREQFIGFLRGNAIKYLARVGRKGNADDARRDYEKARHYQDRLAEALPSFANYRVWQPIESAPENKIVIAAFEWTVGEACHIKNADMDAWHWAADPEPMQSAPTHWMPMPPPPEES